jgi:hypothetical protein
MPHLPAFKLASCLHFRTFAHFVKKVGNNTGKFTGTNGVISPKKLAGIQLL